MRQTSRTNTGRGISQTTEPCHMDEFVKNSRDPLIATKPIHLSCPCQKCNPHYVPSTIHSGYTPAGVSE